MAVTQHASGSQAASIGTEHFLGTDPETTAAAFQFVVDCSVMVRGDSLEIRVYEKVNDSGDTAMLVKMFPVNNEQDEDLFVSPAFMLLIGWRFSIKQTAGTGRTFQWSIRKAA